MRTINKLCLALATLALTACSASSNKGVVNPIAEYEAMTPFQFSDTRVKHVGLISDMDLRIQMEQGLMDLSKDYFSPQDVGFRTHVFLDFDTLDATDGGLISDMDLRIQMEQGLMDLSKDYFSPQDVGFRTHVFLDFDTLDATDGSRGLLGTNRDDNPNGLNPAREEAFETGNGLVTGATILLDIYELDFYKNDHLKGISLAMVVNDSLEQDGQDYLITEEVMQNYLEVTSNKLVSYMRERYNEIAKNIPIYIAAYQLNTQDDSSKGHFMYEGLFQDNKSQFSKIEEEWVNIPSSNFTKIDAKTADEFNTFKQDIATVLPDQTYVVGTARYEKKALKKMDLTVTAHGKTASEILAVTFKQDIATVLPDQTYVVGTARYEKKALKKMDLTVTAHGKTASEILAVCQTIQEGMDTFTDTDCTYLITVYNDEEVYAMIQRLKNTKETTIVSKL